ncbi:hypothetical protein KZX37_00590 [Microbacterium sp. EYE_5]|uniref:lipopolysaccharide biosynthesis protein n=1 Tax=unclassified Microbacterium TaxID=2609290 RepID=UPI00200335A8|nr:MULTISPECIES: hypothetical protein [unclassified Microbacterium]MCK6079111.1 hypothetical protein [Microbacterium sp. EYE_382]MCK6084381.1 hypothetical protein [Microbacterium sp. EYE_384]MCK6123390.1 hypothetical protein [Microbacterium sp. EYE_80]MCK6125145.1 hypothetical protein [Microbacterium sp. EYE_79]MCK6140065.1 hypothetical protein [Microbacterium sp. EYE_39]
MTRGGEAGLTGRLISFSTLPFISLVIPLIALPIVARVGGVDTWAALTVGQALGGYAVAVSFAGWNVLGTPRIALAKPEARRPLYELSFAVRLCVFAVIAPIAALVGWLIAPDGGKVMAVFAVISSALPGLGVAWYAVGASSPMIIAKYELVPRAIASVASIPLVLLTGVVEIYVICLVIGPLLGLVVFNVKEVGRAVPPWPGRSQITENMRDHRGAWMLEASGNLYAGAPVPIAGALSSPALAASYGSADKVYRYALFSVVAFGNALQGWVLGTPSRRSRHTTAIVLMATLGVLGGSVIAFGGSALSALLFGAKVAATSDTMLWLGLAFAAVAMSTPLIRNVLVPSRREKQVLIATLCSAVVGVTSMVILGLAWGSAGVSAGLAISECTTLAACVALVATRNRTRPSSGSEQPA